MYDLSTVTAVKAYLSITSTGQDSLIASLIARESRVIENYLARTFPYVSHTQKRLNGTGSATLMLPDNPVLSVSYLAIDGVEIPASTGDLVYGYGYDDTAVYLTGARFPKGLRNVACSWTAGYVTDESGTIPAGNTPTLTPTSGGRAVVAEGVTRDSDGVAFTEVAGNVASGQFSFANGTFSFASADAGNAVTMSYRFIPGPVEQACIEMVGTDLKQRDNLGIRSKSLAGESISYTSGSLTVGMKQMLMPYLKRALA